MKELIKAYLLHTEHYLAGNPILSYSGVIGKDDIHYEVVVENNLIACNKEYVEIKNSELLTFLFERTL